MYETFKKNNIHILQFQLGQNILSYSQGKFLDIYKINEFYHSASTENGSSGSSIFTFYHNSMIIFGIHKGGIKEENKNLGDFIFQILDSLKRDSTYERSEIFKGEIIENYIKTNQKPIVTECIQKGRLIILIKEEKIKEYKKDKIYIGDLYHTRQIERDLYISIKK